MDKSKIVYGMSVGATIADDDDDMSAIGTRVVQAGRRVRLSLTIPFQRNHATHVTDFHPRTAVLHSRGNPLVQDVRTGTKCVGFRLSLLWYILNWCICPCSQ